MVFTRQSITTWAGKQRQSVRADPQPNETRSTSSFTARGGGQTVRFRRLSQLRVNVWDVLNSTTNLCAQALGIKGGTRNRNWVEQGSWVDWISRESQGSLPKKCRHFLGLHACLHSLAIMTQNRSSKSETWRRETGAQRSENSTCCCCWSAGMVWFCLSTWFSTEQQPRVKTGIIFSALGIDNQPSVRYILLNLTKCELE